MALNLTVLILVLAITFMHAIFGFFSGLINLFCTVVAVVVSLGFYEALNDVVTSNFAGEFTAYTEPLCLIGLFIFSLAILRTLADNYIRGNVKLPVALDWVGASLCGLLNAQMFVGILVISITMLPLGGRVLGYSAYERNKYNERNPDHADLVYYERNHLWTRSDEFTAGLFSLLSSGSLRGATTFASVYPDFPEAIFFSTNTVQPESTPSPYRSERGQKRDGWTQGLQVQAWWEEHDPIEARYRADLPTARTPHPNYSRTTLKLAPGKKWIVTQLKLDPTAADRRDRQQIQLFRATMIRLVGQSAGGEPRQYIPLVLANADQTIQGGHRAVDVESNFSLEDAANAKIYAYFEVEQDFRPAFVEYRRHARAAVPPSPTENPEVVLSLAGETESAARAGAYAGRTFGSILDGGSGYNPSLPIPMQRQALQGSGDVVLTGDRYASGRMFSSMARLTPQEGQAVVDQFLIPDGQRLLQIRYKPRRAASIVGQVFNYVAQLSTYIAIDSTAEQYPMVGYYALVTRSGQQYIELYYTGGSEAESAANRGMLDFRNLERNEINDQEDSVLGMLFLVPNGRTIVRIQNNGGDGADVRYVAP